MSVPGVLTDRTLLMKRPKGAAAARRSLALAELHAEEAILADCSAVWRETRRERVCQRRARGLRFFSLREAGRVVANTWVADGGERFLDEAMLVFELDPQEACLRDAFVNPADRGRGLFSDFITTLERGPLEHIGAMWSCVEHSNATSVAAHRRAGFTVAGDVLAVTLLGALMWRRAKLPAGLRCREYASRNAFVWLGARARQFRQNRLA
jgi:hypothetical protein